MRLEAIRAGTKAASLYDNGLKTGGGCPYSRC